MVEASVDLLDESIEIERIELIAKFVCGDESNSRERQVALIWIAELAEDMRVSMLAKINKPPVGGGCISSGVVS
ncbi:hypothetical protein EYZ02_05000 [Hafnia alvei]|nr:hypothetical protein [Hafnia alvei]QBJ32314.1 hypothetical protein EYZ02_05000 [Hafnia alvei]